MKKNLSRGGGFINKLINKLPVEIHWPGYNYCGPGTKLQKRLSRGDTGINQLDEACKQHDISYSQNKTLEERHKADKILINKAVERLTASNSSVGEKIAALGISGVMKAKVAMGSGCQKRKLKKKKQGGSIPFRQAVKQTRHALKNSKSKDLQKNVVIAMKTMNKIKKKIGKPRILPIPKRGGVLPLIPLFAGLSALGALSGGAAGVAKAVNDAKTASKKLEELKRHNETMEAIALGRGVYLKPYKQGLGLYLNSQYNKKKLPIKLPKHALSNIELIKIVEILRIPYFRGVFMRNKLPSYPRYIECGIVNLDDDYGDGTHWVAYTKHSKNVIYFDSFGDLRPPLEIMTYFKNCNIKYNYDNFQKYGTVNCGQLCINFLYNNMYEL